MPVPWRGWPVAGVDRLPPQPAGPASRHGVGDLLGLERARRDAVHDRDAAAVVAVDPHAGQRAAPHGPCPDEEE